MKYILAAIGFLFFTSCFDNSPKNIVTTDKMIQFVPQDTETKYFPYDTISNNILEKWANEVLYRLKEPVINAYSNTGEFIRLVWLRAFENPIVIRINKFNDTVYANIKELRVKANETNIPIIIKDTIITLDRNKWDEFITPLNQGNFWSTSYTDTSFFNKDGATWFLECRLNNKYKIIVRWDDGHFSSKELNDYLGSVVNFGNDHVSLKSIR
jgi:hypothetical protein